MNTRCQNNKGSHQTWNIYHNFISTGLDLPSFPGDMCSCATQLCGGTEHPGGFVCFHRKPSPMVELVAVFIGMSDEKTFPFSIELTCVLGFIQYCTSSFHSALFVDAIGLTIGTSHRSRWWKYSLLRAYRYCLTPFWRNFLHAAFTGEASMSISNLL